MNDEVLVEAEHVSKKFCRGLKRSLWYGVKDIAGEVFFGADGDKSNLRPGEFWALRDVSFEVRRGETLGLIGANGAGKTTLLRLLNGLIPPDRGRIEIRGRLQALIALGAGFNPILTGRENVYVNAAVLGIPKVEVDRRFDEIVAFADIGEFIESPVQSYSSGMRVRLGFAVAAHMSPDILLVDEVLAVGDEGFQSKCLNKIGELRESGTGIILVSHNMHTISTFASRVILLEKGEHAIYDDVSAGIKAYRSLVLGSENADIQRICNGNDEIDFYHVEIPERDLLPGDSFSTTIHYDALRTFQDVEVDIGIYSGNETGLYYQATNKAYDRRVDLMAGRHSLHLEIQRIPINGTVARIAIAIWSENREELLFWWRIPAVFEWRPHSTGKNFLPVTYELMQHGVEEVDG